MNAMKGIHGASEAIRGSLNGTIARGVGDREELERARVVREQGMQEFKGSGLREGFREKAEGRMRLRRKSHGNGESAPEGLDRVEEASVESRG